jgi:hypothetical protein
MQFSFCGPSGENHIQANYSFWLTGMRTQPQIGKREGERLYPYLFVLEEVETPFSGHGQPKKGFPHRVAFTAQRPEVGLELINDGSYKGLDPEQKKDLTYRLVMVLDLDGNLNSGPYEGRGDIVPFETAYRVVPGGDMPAKVKVEGHGGLGGFACRTCDWTTGCNEFHTEDVKELIDHLAASHPQFYRGSETAVLSHFGRVES